ncbi:hypothetical protein LCM20_09765 [Halobacillus litoralis]|uniref:hypothetical protein n=1 Tax=Halobacillus litoralis TaxID=45668 RepID=UPI001CD5CEB3|nr:hypothetical protein [Halobacillus litoralis]MCA0970876.1 hypothetical protein [Halobacillus litoralis]
MKWFVLLCSLFLLVSCSVAEEQTNVGEVEAPEEEEPDYDDVLIQDIDENLLTVVPPVTDPDASYPVYEIVVDEETKVDGAKESLDELRIKDDVEIWLKSTGSDEETAERITVK